MKATEMQAKYRDLLQVPIRLAIKVK